MAVTKPLFINQTEYDAEATRRGLGGLLAQSAAGTPRSGILGPAPAVSLSGSTVQVGACNAAIGSSKGAYLLSVDSTTNAGTLGVADATNPRLDRVVLEVLDPDNGSGGTSRLGRLRVIPGTAAALPGLPTLPPLALHVAQIQVPRTGTPVLTVDCQFTAAAGAPVPVRTQADRDAMLKYEGAQALRLDSPFRDADVVVGGSWVRGGSTKQAVSLSQFFTPDPVRDDLPQETPSVYRAGRRVHLSGVASNTSTVTFGGGTVYGLGSLPEGFRPQFPEYFTTEMAFVMCRVWVRPDGQIYFMFATGIGPMAPRVGKLSLSGISFDAAA